MNRWRPRSFQIAAAVALLAIGCAEGAEETIGTGGFGDSETCRVLCNGCADGDRAAACDADCQARIEGLSGGLDFDACPDALATFGECLEATGCSGQACDPAFLEWLVCVGAVPP